jgi:hypothetical protein
MTHWADDPPVPECHYCGAEAVPPIMRTLDWYVAALCYECEDLLIRGRAPKERADAEVEEEAALLDALWELEKVSGKAEEWLRTQDEKKGIFKS